MLKKVRWQKKAVGDKNEREKLERSPSPSDCPNEGVESRRLAAGFLGLLILASEVV